MNALEVSVGIAEHVQYTKVMGEIVLMDARKGVYLGLGELGSRVWELLAEDKSPRAVVEQVYSEYEVDKGVLERDVSSLLEELRTRGLIDFRHPEGGVRG
jgi:hypothetical protein